MLESRESPAAAAAVAGTRFDSAAALCDDALEGGEWVALVVTRRCSMAEERAEDVGHRWATRIGKEGLEPCVEGLASL